MKTTLAILIPALALSASAFAIDGQEAGRIALDYSVRVGTGLKVAPSRLSTIVNGPTGHEYRIYVGNRFFNNDYECQFNVVVDELTGNVLPRSQSYRDFQTSKEWSCAFVSDNGGGM